MGLRTWLPTGNTLNRPELHHRHNVVLVTLLLHFPVLLWITYSTGHSIWHGLTVLTPMAVITILAVVLWDRAPRFAACLTATGLFIASAILIHLAEGRTEAHFHIFLVISLLGIYQMWPPLVIALIYVILHHGIGGQFWPHEIYHDTVQVAHPWFWMGIHATAVLLQVTIVIYKWHTRELEHQVRLAAERASTEKSRFIKSALAITQPHVDLQSTLDAVVREVARDLGDACVLRIYAPATGSLSTVAVYHHQPSALIALRRSTTDPVNARDGVYFTVMSGQTMIFNHADLPMLKRSMPSVNTDYIDRVGSLSVAITPLKVQDDTIGTMSVFRDGGSDPFDQDDVARLERIAERAAAAIMQSKALQQARDAVSDRDDFISAASHELKTPLTTLKLHAQLFAQAVRTEQMNPARMLHLADQLDTQVNQVDALTNRLLDVARINQDRLDPHLDVVEINIADLVREAIAECAPLPDQAARLIVQVANVMLRVDPMRIRQALCNLISNALKYSEDTIGVTMVQSTTDLKLCVEDHGIGITPDDQTTLFQPFQRSELAKQKATGEGLGLFLARGYIQAHGGDIMVESTLDEGSTFCISLPVVIVRPRTLPTLAPVLQLHRSANVTAFSTPRGAG